MKQFANVVSLIVCIGTVLFSPPALAQITDQQAIDYVKNTWELTDLTDDVISQTLNTSYSGIPFKDWINGLINAADVASLLQQQNYTEAAKQAAGFGAEAGFNYLLTQVGLEGVSSVAGLAVWPIQHALYSFVNTVGQKTFADQCAFYFAARAHNTADQIRDALPFDLLDADVNGGLLYKDKDGWLIRVTCDTCTARVLGFDSSTQFYDLAETLWQAKDRTQDLDADQREVGDAFRAAAAPQKPFITQQPQDTVIASGQNATFTVQATGAGTLTYQWYFNGSWVSPAVGSSLQASAPGQYQVIVGNAAGTTPSRIATLTVNAGEPVAITAPAANANVSGSLTVRASVSGATKVEFYLDGVRQFTDSSTPFVWTWNSAITANGLHALTAKAYNGATLLGTSAVVNVTVNNAAPPTCSDPNEPNDSSLTATPISFGVAANGYVCTASDVDWFKVEVAAPGVLTFDLTVPAANDYDIELFGPDYAYIKGSYRDTGLAENITHNAISTGTYYVRVYGYPVGSGSHNTTTPYTLMAGISSGPVTIVTPPQGRSVPAGANASFSVVASGASPLAYQWQRDNVDIPGATGPTYATPTLTLADSGAQFRVRVTNAFGFALSDSAMLTVNTANVITWTGIADGNWFNRTNWNPMTVPTVSDVVQLSSGNVTIPSNAQYALINLIGGSLNGTFTLNGAMNWSGGTLSGDIIVPANSVLTLSGSADKVMSGGVLRNGGTVIWSGTGNLRLNDSSDIENLAGGLFDVQTDATMYYNSGSAPVFNNAGIFRKSGGAGTTTISSVTFSNAGTVDLQSGSLVVGGPFNQTGSCTITAGSLTLQSGGTCQGVFNVPIGSSLQLAGGSFVLSSNVLFSGPGLSRVSNASVALNGSYNLPNIQFDSGTTLTGTFTLSGTMSWTGGTLAGDMTVAPSGVLTLSGGADKVMSGGVLRNGGTVIWSGTGNLRLNDSSDIENLAGGLFDVQTDATMYYNSGSAPVFNNAGTFRKSGDTGTVTISIPIFNNTGVVDVTSGTANFANNNLRLQPGSQLTGTGRVIGSVTLNGNVAVQNLELTTGTTLTGTGTLSGTINWTGGTLAGDLTIAPGGVLAVSGSADKVMSGGVLRNGGTVVWSGTGNLRLNDSSDFENLAGGLFDLQTSPTIYYNSGSAPVFNNAGTLQVESGVVTFSGISPKLNSGTTVTGDGRIAGTLALNGNALLQNFQLANGCTLVGTGTVQGTVSWTDGLVAADITLATNSVLTLSGSANKVMSGGVLRNGGTVIWSGTGNLRLNDSSDIENLAGGLFDVQTDATMYYNSGNPPVFNNAGIFRKSGGTNTTTISSVTFSNAGTVELQSGSLVVGGSFNQTGICTIAAGSLTLQGGGSCQGSFDVSVSSSLQFAGGNFVLSSNVVFSGPGLSRVSNASVALNGSYNLPNIQFDSGTTLTGTFTLSGTMSWTGGTLAGDMTIAPSGVLTLSGGANKVMSGGVLRNGGTVIWSGTGNLRLNDSSDIENLAGGLFDVQTNATMYYNSGSAPVFNNAGTFRKSGDTGTVTISIPIFNNTGVVDVTSGTANFANNNLRLQPGSQLTGTGRVIGSVTLNGNVAVQNLELTTGTTLTGTGTLSGTINWTGGTLSGDVTIAPGGVLAASGSANKVMSGGVLRNGGTVIWSGTGNLRLNDSSDFENLTGGLFDVQTSPTIYYNSGNPPVFNNAGTLQVESGVVTFSGISPKLNSGTTVTGDGRIAGTLALNGNALLQNFQLANGCTLVGTGTVQGTVSWTDGLVAADITLATNSVLTLSGSANKVMSGGVLRNGGTVIWSGTGNLRLNDSSDIENLAGGLFDVQTNATMYYNSGNPPVFNNAGIFRKSGGTNTTTISSVTFSNAGTVELQSGSLVVGGSFNQTGICTIAAGSLTLQGGGSCQGSFDVSVSSSLQFAGGNFVLSSNVVFSGPGLSRVSNASVALNGSYNLPNIQFDSGTTLTGTFTLSGTMSWTGGTLAGDMTIAPSGVLTLSGGANKVMSGGVLRNGGTVIWSGTGNLRLNDSSDIENLAGGLFDVQTNATMYYNSGNPPVFNNAGIFRKSGDTGTVTISIPTFNNTGTVNVTSGTANFANNNLRLQPGSQLTGTGRVIGSVTLNGNVASQNLGADCGLHLDWNRHVVGHDHLDGRNFVRRRNDCAGRRVGR